ncbi:sodium:proton antiporter [Paenibacillus larvae]
MCSLICKRYFPLFPMPILQVALGILIGLFPSFDKFQFEPEIFLILIVAPLLFNEGKNVDLESIWKSKTNILLLSFILVILSVLVLGPYIHWLLPAIPLAACFAMAAALGPTDAVSVVSISKTVKIPGKTLHLLENEGLFNDASGLILLQTAVMALLYGSYSATGLISQLIISTLGGIIVGVGIVFVKNRIISVFKLHRRADIQIHLIFELILPIISYIVAELFHFSGIIAAVSAGIMFAFEFKRISQAEAERSTISQSIWEVILTILNAFVFLFLGAQLPSAIKNIREILETQLTLLAIVVISITILIFLIRFVFIGVLMPKVIKDNNSYSLKNHLIITFAGVKGTVSLAAILSLPVYLNSGNYFEQRDLIIFITMCVILLSMVIGSIMIPIISPKINQKDLTPLVIEIYDKVIKQLYKLRRNSDKKSEYDMVISKYRKRKEEVIEEYALGKFPKILRKVRKQMMKIEMEGLMKLYKANKISYPAFSRYQKILNIINTFLYKDKRVKIKYSGKLIFIILKKWLGRGEQLTQTSEDLFKEIKFIFSYNTKKIKKMEDNDSLSANEYFVFRNLLEERIDINKQLMKGRFLSSQLVGIQLKYMNQLLEGFAIEREVISAYHEEHLINSYEHAELIQNVDTIEWYSLDPNRNITIYRWLNKIIIK